MVRNPTPTISDFGDGYILLRVIAASESMADKRAMAWMTRSTDGELRDQMEMSSITQKQGYNNTYLVRFDL